MPTEDDVPEELFLTPPPWTAMRTNDDLILIRGGSGPEQVTVAAVGDGVSGELNAALICAAPEMRIAVLEDDLTAAKAILFSRGLGQ